MGVYRLSMLLICLLLFGTVSSWGAATNEATQDPSWPPKWYGVEKLSCQWSHFFLAKNPNVFLPTDGQGYGEDVHNSYFLWSYPPVLPEGTKILLEGDFPHARMMGFQVGPPWDPQNPSWRSGEGTPEIPLLDVDIKPNPKHINPFLPGADRNATKRHYQVTFELSSGHPVTLNPKAAVPPYRAPSNKRVGGIRSGKTGSEGPYLWLRITAPDSFDPYGGVPLPVVHIQRPGEKPVLAPPIAALWGNPRWAPEYRVAPYLPNENPCQENGITVKDSEQIGKRTQFVQNVLDTAAPAGVFDSRALATLKPDGSLQYYKLFGLPRLMCVMSQGAMAQTVCPALDAEMYNRGHDKPPPGNDEHTSGFNMHNSYLLSAASPRSGEVLVFRGRSPETPRTIMGDAKMGPSTQLRYWSLCVYTGDPAVVALECVMDENIKKTPTGDFNIMLSTENDRPNNAKAECGVTWLSWKKGFGTILLRYQSTESQTWEHALQLVTWEKGDPALVTYDPNAIQTVVSQYFPAGRYMTTQQAESLGCA